MSPRSNIAVPRPWFPIVVAAYAALAVLFVCVAYAQYALVQIPLNYPDASPRDAEFPTALYALMIGFGLCVQLGIVATTVLVSLVRWNRILESRSVRWLDVLCIAVALGGLMTGGLVIVRLQTGPPGLVLILVLFGLALLALALVLLVLRSLLRRAILLRSELDEVV
ncbi:MAG: DUF2975 domain-containing protein [Pseudolysinimonas sp.]|uniref:DUF2975 domain-containing protein n=1 Tax=Pseudolysinimonas sp. TaxID=2680009 RepID=UPI003265AA47